MAAATAALRIGAAAGLVVLIYAVSRFSAWWLFAFGAAALVLLWRGARLQRDDRLALWLVLVGLLIIGQLHNANTWQPDGRGLFRPQQVWLWKTELVLAVALAVPLFHAAAPRIWSRGTPGSGRRFAQEFALYVNFSGIALALWDGDAALSRPVGVMLLGWVALAELTLYASD